MASVTPNLKLVIEDGLSASARSNLLKIDGLAQAYNVDQTANVQVRSARDLLLIPNSPDVGGTGVGGTVRVGLPGQPVGTFQINTENFSVSSVTLEDQTQGSTGSLTIQHVTGNGANTAAPILTVLTEDGDRTLTLGGNLSLTGANLSLTVSADSALTLPVTGTLSTLDGTETLTNKTLDSVRLSDGSQTFQLTASALSASYTLTVPDSLGTAGQVLARTGANGTTWIDLGSVSNGGETSATWTPAMGGTVTIAHPFGTRQVMLEVLDTANNYSSIEVEVRRPNDDEIQLVAVTAPPNNWLILLKEII